MKNKFTFYSLFILFFLIACSSADSVESQISTMEKDKLQNQVTELQKEPSKPKDSQAPMCGKFAVPGTNITGETCQDGTQWFIDPDHYGNQRIMKTVDKNGCWTETGEDGGIVNAYCDDGSEPPNVNQIIDVARPDADTKARVDADAKAKSDADAKAKSDATSKSTPAPTSKMTGRERLLSIEFNTPKQGTLNELKQEYVASIDIPGKYRTRFIEIQNNLNSIIGGYPRYIYVAFNKNGTDVDNKPVLDKLAEVDYDGFGKTKFSVSDIVQSCLSGAGELRTYDANPYNLCVEDLEFIKNPFAEQGAEDSEIESYVKMAQHLAHEYFHHYQNAHALDRGLSHQRDRDNPESTVQAPRWWLEGAAVTFQNAWWRQNWQDLPTLKNKKWSDVSSWTISNVAGDDQYKETRNSIINNEENRGCDANWYISEKDNLSMSKCRGSIMATAYLAHLTSYQTVWVDIPRDYYELGFWGALKKHTGMNQQEFFDSYNKFLRAGNPDDEPPAGWSPNEEEINKYADFLNILTSNK